jgi:hypothetical protein
VHGGLRARVHRSLVCSRSREPGLTRVSAFLGGWLACGRAAHASGQGFRFKALRAPTRLRALRRRVARRKSP